MSLQTVAVVVRVKTVATPIRVRVVRVRGELQQDPRVLARFGRPNHEQDLPPNGLVPVGDRQRGDIASGFPILRDLVLESDWPVATVRRRSIRDGMWLARKICPVKDRFIGSSLAFNDDANPRGAAGEMERNFLAGKITQLVGVPKDERLLGLLLVCARE